MARKRSRTTAVLFLRGLNKPLKLLFKAKCARRELTMTDVVEGLMKFYMENAHLVEPYIDDVIKANKQAAGGG